MNDVKIYFDHGVRRQEAESVIADLRKSNGSNVHFDATNFGREESQAYNSPHPIEGENERWSE